MKKLFTFVFLLTSIMVGLSACTQKTDEQTLEQQILQEAAKYDDAEVTRQLKEGRKAKEEALARINGEDQKKTNKSK